MGDAVAMLAVSRSELVGCVGCDDAVAEAAGRFLNVKNYVKIMECELAKTRVKIGENLFFCIFLDSILGFICCRDVLLIRVDRTVVMS